VDEYYSVDLEDLILAGGEIFTVTASVTRRRSSAKVTPDNPGKWREISSFDAVTQYKKFWKSCIKVDEMEVVKTDKIDRDKRKNIVVDASNFERYL
jgi:hypothetical protein